jgi:hypothetical protein
MDARAISRMQSGSAARFSIRLSIRRSVCFSVRLSAFQSADVCVFLIPTFADARHA